LFGCLILECCQRFDFGFFTFVVAIAQIEKELEQEAQSGEESLSKEEIAQRSAKVQNLLCGYSRNSSPPHFCSVASLIGLMLTRMNWFYRRWLRSVALPCKTKSVCITAEF
jgi:hypothetical protein